MERRRTVKGKDHAKYRQIDKQIKRFFREEKHEIFVADDFKANRNGIENSFDLTFWIRIKK